jgi:hypothetical protein
MAEYLTRFPWALRPTVGGQWDWDYHTSTNFSAGISARNVSWSDSDMQEIDEAMDDGDLNAGTFRKFGADFTCIIE